MRVELLLREREVSLAGRRCDSVTVHRRLLLVGIDLHRAAARPTRSPAVTKISRTIPSTCGWTVVDRSERMVATNSDDCGSRLRLERDGLHLRWRKRGGAAAAAPLWVLTFAARGDSDGHDKSTNVKVVET